MKLYLAVFLSTLHQAAVVTSTCPRDYITQDSSCYHFYDNDFTWPEAVAFCMAYGAHLVELDSEAEFNFIQSKASQAGGMGFWTGGSDALIENEWIWVETGKQMTLSHDWAPGEPEHKNGKDCLGLWGTSQYRLGAWDCRFLLRPICERPKDPQPTSHWIPLVGNGR